MSHLPQAAPQMQTQHKCCSPIRRIRRRRMRNQKSPPASTAAYYSYACAVLVLSTCVHVCSTACLSPLLGILPTASAQQQLQSQPNPNHRRAAATGTTKTLDIGGDGKITYAEYDEILDKTNQRIHFPKSPLDDYSNCDADYPTAFVEYIYLTFYNVEEPLVERTSPRDYDRFLTIVKRVMNECTGDDGECINVENVVIVEDTVDSFDYDATFVDGVGHRQLQNRKKRRGKRNVKKLRVEGRNYSSRRKRLLLREKSKDQRERQRELFPDQQHQQPDRGLQEGTGTCGDMLLNRLQRAGLATFDCLASVEVTAYDLRCLDEQLLAANQGSDGRNANNNGPMMMSGAQVGNANDNNKEKDVSQPKKRARDRDDEGPSLMGRQPQHTALPYNNSDRTDPGILHHSNLHPQMMSGQPEGSASSDTDWTPGAKYSPNHG